MLKQNRRLPSSSENAAAMDVLVLVFHCGRLLTLSIYTNINWLTTTKLL